MRTVIIVLSILGVLFALTAVVSHKPQANDETQSAEGDATVPELELPDGDTEVPGNKAETPAEVSQTDVASEVATDLEETGPSTQAQHGGIDVNKGDLSRSLSGIEYEHKANLRVPDFSVYQRIAENLRQSVRIQIAILTSATPDRESRQRLIALNDSITLIHERNDGPYFSWSIRGYSQLSAEAALVLHGAIIAKNEETTRLLEHEYTKIRQSNLEGAYDATSVLASTFIEIGRRGPKRAGMTATWSRIERELKSLRESDEHITKRTSAVHSLLIDSVSGCVQSWGTTGEYVRKITKIRAGLDIALRKSSNSFERLAEQTEAEMNLLLLYAKTLSD